MRRSGLPILVFLVLLAARLAPAQNPAPKPPAPSQAAFVGFLKSTIDSAPVRSADVRLFFVDSARELVEPLGLKSIETFVDTLRSRVVSSDSVGYFAVWHLAPGRYLMHTRRIGFNPIEAFVTVDSETILQDFAMEPIASVLSKVEIHDVSTTGLMRRLDRVGFVTRKKFNGGEGTFVTPGDIEKYKATTLRDILVRYGIHENTAEIQFDKMPLEWGDVQDYPAELIAGIEIYRHGRPIEMNMSRRGPSMLEPGGLAFSRRILVVIWTYIP